MIGLGVARLSQLDQLVDDSTASLEISHELFAAADEIDHNPGLRRILTDYTVSSEVRQEVAKKLFNGKISDAALKIVLAAVSIRWKEIGSLAASLARQGARVSLLVAQAQGVLDDLETNIFKITRLLHQYPDLAVILDDHTIPRAKREELMQQILAGKVSESSLLLAKRATNCRERTVQATLESYLRIAAALRNHALVRVTAARPLTEEHKARLAAVMAKSLGREVTLQIIIDPSILGGLSVRVGDDVIEGTVAKRLQLAAKLMD